MRKIITSAVLAVVMASPLAADNKETKHSPEKEKLAKELTNLVGINGQIANVFNSIFVSLEQQMTKDDTVNVGDIKKAKTIFEEVFKKFEPKIVDVSIKAAADNFSDSELKEINAFYSTPAGQKIIKTIPVVMQQSMQGSIVLAQEILNEVDKRIDKELPELASKLKKQAEAMQKAEAENAAKSSPAPTAPAKK